MFTKKQGMVLLSLLVFGLLGAASSAFGQVVFLVTSNTNQVRFEGLKEGVGQVVLTVSSMGTIKSGSQIIINYQAPIANPGGVGAYNPNVTCTNTGAAAPVCASGTNLTSTVTSSNTLTLTFTADVHFVDSNTIVITGVRINANAFGSPSSVIVDNAVVSAQVPSVDLAMFPITFTGTTAVPVADINPKALSVSLVGTPTAILSCVPPTSDSDAASQEFTVSLAENFNQALTTTADETGISSVPVVPTNGANLLFTFTGVPNNVSIEFEGATLVSGTYATSLAGETAFTSTSANGTLQFFAPTTADAFLAIDSFTYTFEVFSTVTPLPTGLVPSAITLTVQLVDANPVVSTDTPVFSTSVNEGSFVVTSFSDCVTFLLFPWVTNFNVAGNPAAGAHFDTGITFANTTGDPFGPAGALPTASGGAMPQAGTCSMVMFANDGTVSGVAATGAIPAGGTAVIDAANVFPTKSGYVFARCNFQNAHAFTYITDNYPMPPNTAVDYLGLIVPNPNIVPRNPAGFGAGEALNQ